MRIGGEIKKSYANPDKWINMVKDLTYSTVQVPVAYDSSVEEKRTYMEFIKKHDLILGEVGAWKNPISKDDKERNEALTYCKNQLALADEMGANCCVNIVGSRGDIWDGCYPENYSEDTYSLIVDTIRDIIDSVNPMNTFYTIEPMPWMVPDSPDSYLQLIKAVDRKAFGVHLDYTNMINCPKRYSLSSAFIQECFTKLGPYIKSIHVKDVLMKPVLPCCIEEVYPGKGTIDFRNVLRLCEGLGKDTTVFVEHIKTYDEYKEAVQFIREVAKAEHIYVK